MTLRFSFILLMSCMMGCGAAPEVKQVSITMRQALTSFDSEDILSLWVFETSASDCESLEADIDNTSQDDTGFITSDFQNAQTLEAEDGATFELNELPPDTALTFFAKINNGSGEVLTHGCNQTEAIGKGNLLTLKIILDPLQ